MPIMNKNGMLLTVVLCGLVMTSQACAQSTPQSNALATHNTPDKVNLITPELAITYSLEEAKVTNTTNSTCTCFFLQGGSAELAWPLKYGFAITGKFTGEYVSNIQPGLNLGVLSYLAGPRYTFNSKRLTGIVAGTKPASIYVEALVGSAHGFDSSFPTSGVNVSTANSLAIQAGGGLNMMLGRGFGIRLPELDYVHTSLPNTHSNSQNDLRVAFGVVYSFKKR